MNRPPEAAAAEIREDGVASDPRIDRQGTERWRPTRSQRQALMVGAIGFPLALWFNHAILPTDDPGPIAFGTVIVILIILARDGRRGGAGGE